MSRSLRSCVRIAGLGVGLLAVAWIVPPFSSGGSVLSGGSPATRPAVGIASLPTDAVDSDDGAWEAIPQFPPLEAHSAICDPVRDRLLIFGGSGGNRTWVLPLSGPPRWSELEPAGTVPSPRSGHTAVYDAARDRMIVFGGISGGSAVNEVWALSLAGAPAWSRLAPTGTPPSPVYSAAAIYDPVRDRMIVYWGIASNVWALTLSGTPAWTRLTPSGSGPSISDGHTAIYDPVRDRMVVAGSSGGPAPTQVWALSLTGSPSWARITPAGGDLAGRRGHTAVYDPAGDRMIVFGGAAAGFGYDNFLNETWSLALGGIPAWSQVSTAMAPPPVRSEHAAILDPLRGRMLVVAGSGGNGQLRDDTWSLELTVPPAWRALAPEGAPPFPRSGHAAIYDAPRDRIVVFGGSSYDDTWQLRLSGDPRWERMAPAGDCPSARAEHTAVFDPARERMIVFGGAGLDDLWQLSLAGAPAWSPLAASGPPPPGRSGHVAIYDPSGDRMIVFGGEGLSDLWELSLAGAPAWQPLIVAGTPPSGGGHAALYDPARNRMLLYAGSEVWELSLAGPPAWSRLSPAGSPPPWRRDASAVYDPVRDRMIVFGGGTGTFSVPTRSDAWALALSGTPEWRELAPTGLRIGRFSHSATYDPVRDRMIVFGGNAWVCAACFVTYSDTRALAWGEPPAPVLACPSDVSARGGDALPCEYGITNPFASPQSFAWSLASDRAWPGFPMNGEILVAGGATHTVTVQASVPDSAAPGSNTLRFSASLASGGSEAVCSHDFQVCGQARLEFMPRDLNLASQGRWVTVVVWPPAPFAASQVDVASIRLNDTVPVSTEHAPQVDADDTRLMLKFDRAEVARTLKAGHDVVVTLTGTVAGACFGGSTAVTAESRGRQGRADAEAPGAAGGRAVLALRARNPVVGPLTVSFRLAGAAPAELTVHDVSGRRVISREVAGGPGWHTIELGQPPAGLYVVRLSQGARSLSTRVAVIP